MKRAISLLLAICLVVSMAGCNDFPASEEDLNESQVPGDLKVSHLTSKESGEPEFNLYYDMNLILAVHYPSFGNGLDQLVIDEVNDIRGGFTTLVQGFKAERFKKRGTLFVDYETFKKDDLVSVVFHITTENIPDESMDETVRTIVYDTARGREITADSYFKSTYLSFVNGIASEELAAAAKAQGVKDYTFTPLESYSKFAVKSDGVEFYFSKNDFMEGKQEVSFKVMADSVDDYVMYGKIDPDKPMIAITFDDGPGQYTSELLDVLERYGVRATFFLVGNNLAESKSDLLKRMVSLDCEIGSHSKSHDDLSKVSASAAADDITAVSDEIKELTGGYQSVLYRPPFRAYTKSMISELKSRNMTAINWSIDTLDWKHRDSDWVYEQATNVDDGDIILMHDIHKTTVEAVERIVKKLLEDGYQLLTVSELLEQRQPETTDRPVFACYKSDEQ